MGYKDYEYERDTLNNHNETILENNSTNLKYIENFSNWVLKNNSITNIFNRPVFKYTMLRDDIFFINCTIYDVGISNFSNVTLVANEKSIWRRFTFYKDETYNSTYGPSNDFTGRHILQKAIRENIPIKLNIYGFEKDEIKQAIDSHLITEEEFNKYNLNSDNIVRINSFTNKSKYLWMKYFDRYDKTSLGDDKTKPVINLSKFKNPSDDSYYDITSPETKKYSVLL